MTDHQRLWAGLLAGVALWIIVPWIALRAFFAFVEPEAGPPDFDTMPTARRRDDVPQNRYFADANGVPAWESSIDCDQYPLRIAIGTRLYQLTLGPTKPRLRRIK